MLGFPFVELVSAVVRAIIEMFTVLPVKKGLDFQKNDFNEI